MAEFLHKIRAFLFPNLLTEDPNDYSARVVSERTLTVKDVCRQAVTRGRASTTEEAMEHNVNLFLKEMAYQLANGLRVNTGYFMASAKILGVFTKSGDKFDPNRHEVVFNFTQGSLMRKEIPYTEVDILGVGGTQTMIDQVVDMKTGSIDDILTPNHNLRIGGFKLKIVGENIENGIYLVNTQTKERIKIDDSSLVMNNPSELMILTPSLESGTYNLEVTTQYSGSKLLREPRTAVLDKILTVE